MKYWKNLMGGTVVTAETKPAQNGWWVETTEREYMKYRMRMSHLMATLEHAVAYKKRVLRVDE